MIVARVEDGLLSSSSSGAHDVSMALKQKVRRLKNKIDFSLIAHITETAANSSTVYLQFNESTWWVSFRACIGESKRLEM